MNARHASHRTGHVFALAAVTSLALISLPTAGFAAGSGQGASKGNSNGKQTICHATNSNTNPYVVETPNKNGDVDGHAKHTGPIWDPTLKARHISWGDIIPPFTYNNHGVTAQFPGLNWTTDGQAWFANNCKQPPSGGGGGSTTGTTTGATTGTTTGSPTTGGGGGAGTTGSPSTTGGGGGGGTFTGGGGGTVTRSHSLPRTGSSADAELAAGGAGVLCGLGLLLLAPPRRRRTV